MPSLRHREWRAFEYGVTSMKLMDFTSQQTTSTAPFSFRSRTTLSYHHATSSGSTGAILVVPRTSFVVTSRMTTAPSTFRAPRSRRS